MSDNVKLAEFEGLCKELFKEKGKLEEISVKEKEQSKRVEELKSKIVAHMEENELEKFHVAGHGVVYTMDYFSVQTPKELKDKTALFEYLKKKGIFLEMVSVNSQTLNSFYKQEMEIAIAEGNSEFKVPGIGEPTHTRKLGMRKS